MTTPDSIGDLSRAAYLRQANVLLKSRLTVLAREVTTGLRSDVPAALGGDMGRIAQVESRLIALAAHRQAAATAAAEFEGVQQALAGVQSIAGDLGLSLQIDARARNAAAIDLHAAGALDKLGSVLSFLNVEVGGRFLLSGTATQSPPLDDADGIMAGVRGALAGLPTVGDVIDAVDAWFDAGPGVGGFIDGHYAGTQGALTMSVAPDTSVVNGHTAADPSLRGILKGLVLAALAAEPGRSDMEKASLLDAAGQRIAAGNHELTLVRAQVGRTQEAIEKASARNAAETTAMSLARSDMLAADPYETAAALTETEANLQNLYALTARLSKLSLTDYLR